MTKQEIKQLVKQLYGSMAHLGRRLNPPVTGYAVSLVIDGKRPNSPLIGKIAKALKIKKSEIQPSAKASVHKQRDVGKRVNK